MNLFILLASFDWLDVTDNDSQLWIPIVSRYICASLVFLEYAEIRTVWFIVSIFWSSSKHPGHLIQWFSYVFEKYGHKELTSQCDWDKKNQTNSSINKTFSQQRKIVTKQYWTLVCFFHQLIYFLIMQMSQWFNDIFIKSHLPNFCRNQPFWINHLNERFSESLIQTYWHLHTQLTVP